MSSSISRLISPTAPTSYMGASSLHVSLATIDTDGLRTRIDSSVVSTVANSVFVETCPLPALLDLTRLTSVESSFPPSSRSSGGCFVFDDVLVPARSRTPPNLLWGGQDLLEAPYEQTIEDASVFLTQVQTDIENKKWVPAILKAENIHHSSKRISAELEIAVAVVQRLHDISIELRSIESATKNIQLTQESATLSLYVYQRFSIVFEYMEKGEIAPEIECKSAIIIAKLAFLTNKTDELHRAIKKAGDAYTRTLTKRGLELATISCSVRQTEVTKQWELKLRDLKDRIDAARFLVRE